jgi:hypothetical protein
VVGRHFFSMTGRELAELTGLPRATVIDRYNRAIQMLRKTALERGLDLGG